MARKPNPVPTADATPAHAPVIPQVDPENPPKPITIIVHGASGAGKTRLIETLMASLPPADRELLRIFEMREPLDLFQLKADQIVP